MKMYRDKSCEDELSKIDLGRLPLGESTKIEFYIKNESDRWPIQEIKLNKSDPDVKITFPELLAPSEASLVTIEFMPSLSRREPLDVKHLFQSELWIG